MTIDRNVRDKISEIFVKQGLHTNQVVIGEIWELVCGEHVAWKETVRDIYDALLHSDCTKIMILNIIENRHHDYFCKGKPL